MKQNSELSITILLRFQVRIWRLNHSPASGIADPAIAAITGVFHWHGVTTLICLWRNLRRSNHHMVIVIIDVTCMRVDIVLHRPHTLADTACRPFLAEYSFRYLAVVTGTMVQSDQLMVDTSLASNRDDNDSSIAASIWTVLCVRCRCRQYLH